MTNSDRILEFIRTNPGLTDAQICARTGIRPHQQVNHICRRLAASGATERVEGPEGHIINLPAGTSHSQGRAERTATGAAAPRAEGEPPWLAAGTRTLLLVQCSGRKEPGGEPGLAGRHIAELLPDSLAGQLARARTAVLGRAGLNDRLLAPAWQRYAGTFYRTAQSALAAVPGNVELVILSGGYGLVLADEPLGIYNRKFALGDWPRELLQECLVATTRVLQCEAVVALCSRSTDYAELVRSTPWRELGADVRLGTPDLHGRGGAQVLVPRAMGEALGILLAGELDENWTSRDGVPLAWERLG